VTALVHRVRAVNGSRSPNPVHDDEFARRLGFRGGLVPGAAVYGYMAVLPERRWGAAWRAGGTMSARFAKPFYDGEEVTVTAAGEGDALDLEARNPEGVVCATGRATVASEEPPPDPDRYPAPELPAERRAPLDVAEGDVLGALRTAAPSEPSWPAGLGNEVLMANVALPPWIHVETRTRHLAELRDGEPVEVRALVAGAWERRGHHFVDLDVLVLGESGRPAARLRHIAIVTLAEPDRIT
jgi:hypothetical protein